MVPSLDDVQQAVNKSTHLILDVSRGIAQWGQERYRNPTASEIELQLHKPHVHILKPMMHAQDVDGEPF